MSNYLALIINKQFRKGFSPGLIDSKQSKYIRLVNCQELITPRVNNEVWRSLDKAAKQRDLRFSNIDKAIVHAAAAVGTLLDKINHKRSQVRVQSQ